MKKEKSEKYLTIRVPKTLMQKFRQKCNEDYKTMSDALRDCIRKYIKQK
jgi:metal-responsive CopG/Arc/MetJ family transcriptional regulator